MNDKPVKDSWRQIPVGQPCERFGCQAPAECVHHVLRDEESYRRLIHVGTVDQVSIRNLREYLQYLCIVHHHADLHELFSASGGWPAGYGHLEKPLRRNDVELETLIAECRGGSRVQRLPTRRR